MNEELQDQRSPASPLRPRHRTRWWAAAGAVAVVLAVVGTALIIDRHRPSASADSTASRPDESRLNRMVHAAPCRLVVRDRHPADAAKIARFRTAAVVECRTDTKTYPGAGEWQVLIRRVSVSGLTALTAALERPDAKRPSGLICDLILYGPLPILLADGTGRYLHPRAPTSACGGPQVALQRAMKQLRWRTVSVTRLVQVRTQASIAAGCEMQWKNENGVETGMPSGAGGPVFAARPNAALKICLYRAAKVQDAGTFHHGLTMTGRAAAELRTALAGPGPARTCPAQHDFAVIQSGDQWVNVELGGCWRVLRSDLNPASSGSAAPSAVERLLGLA